MKKYDVLGYANNCGAEVLAEFKDYNEAKGWVAGYVRFDGSRQSGWEAVSYTHLTLPTILLV